MPIGTSETEVTHPREELLLNQVVCRQIDRVEAKLHLCLILLMIQRDLHSNESKNLQLSSTSQVAICKTKLLVGIKK